MRKRDAAKLHNRDQVEVRVNGEWSRGYVLGEPREAMKVVIVPVQSDKHGFLLMAHTEVR